VKHKTTESRQDLPLTPVLLKMIIVQRESSLGIICLKT